MDINLISKIGKINNIIINGKKGTVIINSPELISLSSELNYTTGSLEQIRLVKPQVSLDVLSDNITIFENKEY